MNQQSNIIIGPGALGLTFGLSIAEHFPVTLVATPDSLVDYKSQGLSLCFPDRKNKSSVLDVVSLDDIQKFPPQALIWICVKAYQLEQLYPRLLPRLTGDQTVILCSNGLGLYDEALALLRSKSKVIRLLAWFGSKKTNRQNVIISGNLLVSLFADPKDLVFEILKKSGFTTEPTISALSAEWSKAATNMVVNSICTINNVTNGELLSDPRLNLLARKLLSEIRQVAKKVGHQASIPSDEHFFKLVEVSAGNTNSTLVDKRLGRQTEMEFLLGRLIKIATENNVAVPIARELLANV